MLEKTGVKNVLGKKLKAILLSSSLNLEDFSVEVKRVLWSESDLSLVEKPNEIDTSDSSTFQNNPVFQYTRSILIDTKA